MEDYILYKTYFVIGLAYLDRGHPSSANLRYGEEDSISPSALTFAAMKGLTQDIYFLYPP